MIWLSNEYDSEVECREVELRVARIQALQNKSTGKDVNPGTTGGGGGGGGGGGSDHQISVGAGSLASHYQEVNKVVLLTDQSIMGWENKWLDQVLKWLDYHTNQPPPSSSSSSMTSILALAFMVENSDKVEKIHAVSDKIKKAAVLCDLKVMNDNDDDDDDDDDGCKWRVKEEDFFNFTSLSLKYAYVSLVFEKKR
jgi:hypothetical protein